MHAKAITAINADELTDKVTDVVNFMNASIQPDIDGWA